MPLTIRKCDTSVKDPSTGNMVPVDMFLAGGYVTATGDQTDMSSIIQKSLQETGICRLGPGDFYVSGIIMPERSTLRGSGAKTRIILSSGVEGAAITMNSYCAVEDLFIVGSKNSITPDSVGNRDGILWQGTFDPTSPSYSEQPDMGTVRNVRFANLTGSGIKLIDTGYGTFNCLTISDCYFRRCGCGINIPHISEFNRITNCTITGCYYGCINNGGNNVFVNCNFSENTMCGFLIDNSQGQSLNNAHGAMIGCEIAHSGGNTGDAIKIINSIPGYNFVGCQVAYGNIIMEDAKGIVFDGCIFINVGEIEVSNGGLILFTSSTFNVDNPNVVKTGSTKVVSADCYNKLTGNAVAM